MSYTPNAPILSEEYATILICLSGGVGLLFALYQYIKVRRINIYSHFHDQYSRMEENRGYNRENLITVYEAISEGASAFLSQEFKYMYIFIAIFSIIITVLVGSAGNCGEAQIVDKMLQFTEGSCWKRGGLTAASFAVGGLALEGLTK